MNLRDHKTEIVLGSSNGRTESTKELTLEEAKSLISYLKSIDPDEASADKMRKKIISMAHEMNWRVPGSAKADMKRIDGWCKEYSKLKKSLDNHTLQELPALVTQFKFVYNSYIRSL